MSNQINVVVINIREKIFLAEFNYFGGLMKNQVVYALIESGDFEQIFLIPIDYSRKIIEVVL